MVACPVPLATPGTKLRASVPATSANLGPGFDSLGLALGLRLEVDVRGSTTDRLVYHGDGSVNEGADNLVHAAFRAVHDELGLGAPSVTFEVRNPIPLARGLGSSSAALVAGAALANELTGGRLGRHDVFRIAAAIEGHPDNVAPAVYGGFTVSAEDAGGEFRTATLPLPAGWRFLFGVPPFELATSAAREVLPDSYSRRDAVLAASRAALWVAAVATDRPELLRAASLDVLHQPHRAALVPGFEEASAGALEAGAYAVFLSGAGPTVGLVCGEGAAAACEAVLRRFAGEAGRVLALLPTTGYRVARC